jgi:CBS domain-containing protein
MIISQNNQSGLFFAGLGAGAALMFYLDPDRGRRRRALVRDQLTRTASGAAEAAESVRRDLSNQTRGAVARLRRRYREKTVDDGVLVERVRSRLGRLLTQPRAIDVESLRGEVTVSGTAAADEVRSIVRAVKRVPGVRRVNNRLTTDRSLVSSLQQPNQSTVGGVPTALLAIAGAAIGARVAYRSPDATQRLRHKLNHPNNCVAADVMTPNPVCCSPTTTLDEVAKLMRHADCGEIPIVDTAGRPVGVVTDRDIVCRVAAEGKNPAAHIAEECMTQPVVAVSAGTPLDRVIAAMEGAQIRRVPVVDDQGCCVGIVAQADIARATREESVGELVREVSR